MRRFKAIQTLIITVALVGTFQILLQVSVPQYAFVSTLEQTTGNEKKNVTEETKSSLKIRNHFDEIHVNYSEFWRQVHKLAGNDTLYQRTYDTTQVTRILRKSKIVHADLFKEQTSLKFKLTLEGNQTAIFKIKLVDRMNRSKGCNTGCEHPEYEIAAYTLNRMFDLRNMPFTTGRVISWSELEPVASQRLGDFVHVHDDYSVCLNWTCLYEKHPTTYCFDKGKIRGSIVYFIKDRIHFLRSREDSIYHGYYIGTGEKRDIYRLPGDKKFCRKFRKNSRYKDDGLFLDLVDIGVLDYMMSHRDAKHTYISRPGTNSEPELYNVMYDFGHAFCRTDDVAQIAPLIQCCRMRTRLFNAMVKYKDSLEETFLTLTRDDPLHPLLLPELMLDMTKKFKQTLAFIEFCRNLDGDSKVFIDI